MKTRAPLRISFAGGGTDIEPYVSEHGGAVLASAIRMYACAEYPSESQAGTALEKTILNHYNLNHAGLKIDSDVPPMSGLGGSASCFVAGIKAVKPDLSPVEIAETAFHLERHIMGVSGGCQDQYMAALGGMQLITCGAQGVRTEQIKPPSNLASHLLLVYLGKRNRQGADIIQDQMKRDNLDNFHYQKELVYQMKDALAKDDLVAFGALLNLAWLSKVRFSPYVTTGKIHDFQKNCMDHGAIGGKLTGAGGGGFMLLMEHPDCKGKLRQHLVKKNIPFETVEFDTEGVCVKNH